MTKKVPKTTALSAYINYVCTRNNRATSTSIARCHNRWHSTTADSISHDAIQRLVGTAVDWTQKQIEQYGSLVRTKRGWLIIDDTIIDKRYSKECPCLSWGWSSSEHRSKFGMTVVLLLWTDGITRVPLGVRLWKKGNDVSKIELATELLDEAKKLWKPRVDYVLFDAWYSAVSLMKHIRSLKWHWVCRIKCNRTINGTTRVEDFFPHHYGSAKVRLNGDVRAFVVKNEKGYIATSMHSTSPAEVKKIYRGRQWIEETFKILKSCLHLQDCQARTEQVHHAHINICLMAFCQLEKYRLLCGFDTIYQLREELLELPIPANLNWNNLLPRAA